MYVPIFSFYGIRKTLALAQRQGFSFLFIFSIYISDMIFIVNVATKVLSQKEKLRQDCSCSLTQIYTVCLPDFVDLAGS